MPNALQLSGRRFGRLLVKGRAANSGRDTQWHCVCNCGAKCIIRTNDLRRGVIKSCGCLRRETSADALRTHGASGTPTWRRWRSMIARCTMPNTDNYRYYGGRGIKVCDRWIDSFETFLADLGECPGREWTIDRSDNDLGYEPDNCRWATQTEQTRNRSNNRRIKYRGEERCVTDWAEVLGIPSRTIYSRLNRGWAPEDALSGQRSGDLFGSST